MKKTLFTIATIAIATMAFSSCSQDTILEQAISENGKQEITVRARNYSSNYNVVSFGNGDTKSFFAYGPVNSANVSAEITATKQMLSVSVPTGTVSSQEDVVAAKSLNVYSTSTDLEFQHVLAQVRVDAYTDCPALHVEVKSVGIENIYTKGSYEYSSNSWALDAESKGGSYYKAVGQTINTSSVELTGTDALLLIPQSGVSAWTKSRDDDGARIAILCKIKDNDGFQIYPAANDPSNDEEGYAKVYVPVKANWTAGASYTYTVVFGDTTIATAVYDADGASVLDGSSISFDPTVEGWTNVSSGSNM